MQCKDIEFGTGDCAYNVHLPWLVDGKAKMVNIDKCLLPEIIHLWELGIKTTGCCCGHGKTDMQEPFIGVEFAYIDKMLELGYKVCPNKYRPRDRDSFYPKTVLQYGSANKGFNWWDGQEGCEVKW